MGEPRRALLLSGGGRYSDPWHPFPETSARLAAIVASAGFQVTVRDDVDDALADLQEPGLHPALLVVNVGLPRDGAPSPAPGAPAAGLRAVLRAVPVLGIHSSSTSFIDTSAWADALGGRWVRGVSMHPDYEPTRAEVTGAIHPITAGVRSFNTTDERYSYLEHGDVTVLLDHEFEGRRHALFWAGERAGVRRVYDALGHDGAAYDSPIHREVLARAARWLVEEDQ